MVDQLRDLGLWALWFGPAIISIILTVAAVHQWRRPSLRWAVPLALIALFAGGSSIWPDAGTYVLLAPAIGSVAALVGVLFSAGLTGLRAQRWGGPLRKTRPSP